MTDTHTANKEFIKTFRRALYDTDASSLRATLEDLFAADAVIHMANPLETLSGPGELFDAAYEPLIEAIPDLERRDFIVMADHDERTGDWVGCAGHYVGVFEEPWLDIPPTQHAVHMRYHEFFRIEDEQIVEMQSLWDIPAVMMQAGAWPMTPSLGVEWMVPGPATNDGIVEGPHDADRAAASAALVTDMLDHLKKSVISVEAMELDRFWHQRFNWYGPAGIGTTRRVSGFRNWHQIPWLNAFPDRRGSEVDNGCWLGDGDYVSVTAWPGMHFTLTGDGFIGMPPTDQALTGRSLDFWRCEDGMIRENWVLVDILDLYSQIGVDVFARMRETTPHRRTS